MYRPGERPVRLADCPQCHLTRPTSPRQQEILPVTLFTRDRRRTSKRFIPGSNGLEVRFLPGLALVVIPGSGNGNGNGNGNFGSGNGNLNGNHNLGNLNGNLNGNNNVGNLNGNLNGNNNIGNLNGNGNGNDNGFIGYP